MILTFEQRQVINILTKIIRPESNAEQNKELVNKSKLQTPVLVLAGDIYPVLGGDVPGNPVLEGIKLLAQNMNGTIVPLSGHYIP